MKQHPDFQNLVPHFNYEGEYIRAERYGYGHIHDTYVVFFKLADGRIRKYLLQRINHFVFANPAGLMKNIAAITAHLRRKVIAAGGDPARETLSLVPTRSGSTYHQSGDGMYWRSYHFIEDAQTYQFPASMQHVYNAARSFGTFQLMLADFPLDELEETIPDFHHTPKRFEAFARAVQVDAFNRAGQVREEIAFALRRAEEAPRLVDLIDQGRLPLRVTHNDTKFNNVMIDDHTGQGLCVIDLDTVMPGSALYDFGDAIRSIANMAKEDERDLSQVRFSLEIFGHYASGYLDAVRPILSTEEIELLPFSARLMTLECGLRFLTDYLNGDVYFHTQRQDQNLDRCRVQFRLLQEMEARYDAMIRVIQENAPR